jgi:short-subunit dehydrogenase
LLPEGIAVSIVCPGFVRTAMTDQNRFPMPLLMELDAAAREIVDGIAKKTQEIHFPKAFSLTIKLLSSLPSPLYTRIMGAVSKRAGT